MPNTGKSTFFNRLTGSSSRVGNWPGVTVDLLSARVVLGGDAVEVVDLPGIYDLHGFSDDERIVRSFLENNSVDLVGVVLNATQLDHQLPMALQVRQLGMNTATMKYFIDLADSMDWEYMIVDWTWYGNVFSEEGNGSPDPSADITTSIEEVDIHEIIEYANERDVGIILWVLSGHIDRQMDEMQRLVERIPSSCR